MKLHDERRDYERAQLRRSVLNDDPFKQFESWFAAAKEAAVLPDPTAFTLATVNAQGQPHQRIVLMKDLDANGFVFYTNYASQKGHDLAANNKASMHFSWLPLEQQVRIEGQVEKVDRAVSEAYFHSRPRTSQLGALASQQSETIGSRTELEQVYHDLTERYEGKTIPMPESWGGYRVCPDYFEFWQGGRFRLHDRFIYQRDAAGSWTIERLQP
ncbi:pyridoxamine 5'-phosphate oxidase [Pseudidiomarina terrestris]|uniref:Pyridoxine/pyridoxamine 5'-phosphate oxidase n=1 Tax=Pseudidiomarina terrestris TaxID=2820060 RepID=A0AAW7QXW3_9GAMM|nr:MULTISPECIES: pyridoxamine 5'-phosphate oxidase [unclassified Pseudidiomarina]MDN7125075.1 pyridoxamine 5'-phosphate oxidase [Pseudidiomarina sp. 1APP75-32.1]MDN7129833.1 pyridoxamine 5'-phosphate oxidase [Pseudidiomarina sp. 1APR75-15]MDN7136001.1 pyridoxamine 5'-phosphate oxidase [Pseudidiomarina sp. 1ASP75-5]MDN7138466.1 pyridoxamine 5'-phosphate oxidase [Pseudidiomarina sp. 1ASP75-14]MEA3589052.1 pyridoxamine 5'-phosphate oxidase [Pseudidiomarina sp. 1APP75-27a]